MDIFNKNILKKIYLIITILILNITQSKAMLPPPAPLVNDASFNGGICFANAGIQSLLQIPEFYQIATSGINVELKGLVDPANKGRNRYV